MQPASSRQRLVVDLDHLPSSLKGFRQCPRRWWFQQHAPEQTGAQFTYGKLVHAQRERYLLDGTMPEDPGARMGLEHLPPAGSGGGPDPRVLVEHGWGRQVGLLYLHGTADIIDLRRPGMPAVGDHKTTASIKDYALRHHEIATDLQLNCYAYYVLTELEPDASTILLQHHYVQKNPSAAKTVEAEVSRDQIEAAWAGMLHTFDKMLLYLMLPAEQVPCNREHCGDYGGCPFLEPCMDLVA